MLEAIETILLFAVFVGIVGSWVWCAKNPKKCIDWGAQYERRKLRHPITFMCRRKKAGNEEA